MKSSGFVRVVTNSTTQVKKKSLLHLRAEILITKINKNKHLLNVCEEWSHTLGYPLAMSGLWKSEDNL